MTEKHYEIIITALTDKVQAQAEKINELETRVLLRDYDIEDLKKKLAEAGGTAEVENGMPV